MNKLITTLTAVWVGIFAAMTVVHNLGADGTSHATGLEGYYRNLETAVVEDARECLNEMGYLNSGVMLTRVIQADGSREYTLTIHHYVIDRMSDTEREALHNEFCSALENEISEFTMSDNCSFQQKFLINQ